jgi:hypothetical protein
MRFSCSWVGGCWQRLTTSIIGWIKWTMKIVASARFRMQMSLLEQVFKSAKRCFRCLSAARWSSLLGKNPKLVLFVKCHCVSAFEILLLWGSFVFKKLLLTDDSIDLKKILLLHTSDCPKWNQSKSSIDFSIILIAIITPAIRLNDS